MTGSNEHKRGIPTFADAPTTFLDTSVLSCLGRTRKPHVHHITNPRAVIASRIKNDACGSETR